MKSVFARMGIIFLTILLAGLVTLPTLANQTNNYPASFNAGASSKSQLNCSNQDSFFSKLNPQCARIVVQAGIFNASPGSAQNIGIQGLVGDHFTVKNNNTQNILVGAGYFIDGFAKDQFRFLYGLNPFYLAKVPVQGKVIQEHLFANLSYHYTITNYPIYVSTRALIFTDNDPYNIVLDLGIGPNIIQTNSFKESSLDDGITLPDNMFSGQSNVAFSATVGIGVKFNRTFGCIPLEIGYRFFYLGQGELNKSNSQVTDTLKTGHNYANALVISVDT